MSNYKQTTVSGDSWVRASRILIDNPLNQPAQIRFVEDTVINLADTSITQSANSVLSEIFSDSTKDTEFNVINPSTGDVVATATYKDVYAMLHSLYIHLATKRDSVQ
jgi:hypothetical protein